MLEFSILKLFTRDIIYYNRYYNIVKDISLEKEIKIILTNIHRYYSIFPHHEYIGQEEFTTFFLSEYPQLKNKEEYLQLISRMFSVDVSDSLASDVMQKLLQVHTANHIVNELLPIVSGNEFGLLDKLHPILEKYQSVSVSNEEESPFVECSLEDLFEARASDGLLWRTKGLQEALGSLCGGSLGHVFARPETGKTTLLHSESANFVSQLTDEHPLLWFNNEEDSKAIKLRFYSAVCGATVDQIRTNTAAAAKMFAERGGNRMHLYDAAVISTNEVEALCKKYKPRLVVIDQGDKLVYKGQDKAGNGAERLKHLYDGLREITKRCNECWKMDMLTVGQADAAAEGRKWLYQTNLDGGKTGKAGAFDYIIGIGKTYNEAEETTRFVSLCKNKLTGNHGKFISTIDPGKARYL